MYLKRLQILPFLWAIMLISCQAAPPSSECADAIGCVVIGPGEPIEIGVLQALSGDMAPQGLELLQVADLAIDDRGGELLGHPINVQSADSKCSEEGGTTAALRVVADPQLVGIVGPTCSGAAAAAIKIVSESGLVLISGSSSAPSLTSVGGERGPDWQPGFLRTAQNDALVGHAAANFAVGKLGVTKAATINDGDPYTSGLTSAFEQEFAALGGQVVLATTVNKGDTDMRPVLEAVGASRAEFVFLPVFRMEGDYIVVQASEMRELENVILMTAEGLYFQVFIEAVGAAGMGMHFIAPLRPKGPAFDAFTARYEAKYDEALSATPYFAHTYDAVNLLLDTLETVAAQDPREDGKLHIGRQALRDTLYATAGYEGLTGSLTCDKYGDCGAVTLQVTRLDDPAGGIEGLTANGIYTYIPGQ